MNIRAYRLYDQAVTLQPAAAVGTGEQPTLADELALGSANPPGWVLLCPFAFAATWNGGPRPEDIEIRLEEANPDEASPWASSGTAFVQSQLGGGLLTFYPGYQFKTEGEVALWVRGPINAPKDGLAPLESMVDTSLLPCTIAMHWQFTRAHHTIRFATGEPFATLLLCPKTDLETVNVEMIRANEGEDAYAHTLQQMLDAPALQNLFQRLSATLPQPTEEEPTRKER